MDRLLTGHCAGAETYGRGSRVWAAPKGPIAHELWVVEGTNGIPVAMPSQEGADGECRDMAHPVKSEARKTVLKTVTAAL